jgi:hypothetical protein
MFEAATDCSDQRRCRAKIAPVRAGRRRAAVLHDVRWPLPCEVTHMAKKRDDEINQTNTDADQSDRQQDEPAIGEENEDDDEFEDTDDEDDETEDENEAV